MSYYFSGNLEMVQFHGKSGVHRTPVSCPLNDRQSSSNESYGLKVINAIVEPLDSDSTVVQGERRKLRLWDFNPYGFCCSMAEGGDPVETCLEGRVVTESTRIPAKTFFIQDVESHLIET